MLWLAAIRDAGDGACGSFSQHANPPYVTLESLGVVDLDTSVSAGSEGALRES